MKNQFLYRRFRYALSGVQQSLKSEKSLRFQSIAALICLLTLAFLGASLQWWAIFVLLICSILAAELFNTALEHSLDLLHPGQHSMVKLAKDAAAGGVLLLSLASLIIFVIFCFDHFHRL